MILSIDYIFVIKGAGMVGNSVACHLVQNGWKDVVIIDKGGVADGTSKTGSGMLGLFRPSTNQYYFLNRDVRYRILLFKLIINEITLVGTLAFT